jgi:ParB-like chromosome segregation protein Spo0J
MLSVASLLAADSPRLDGENLDHIRTLTEVDGPLPPIVVHRSTMRVIDGMHRLRAAASRGAKEIRAVYFDGTDQEAFVLAVKLNAAHGLPLSQADRAAATRRILVSYPDWSDRAISSLVGVSPKTVGAIRHRSGADVPRLSVRVGLDGRARPDDTAERRRRASEVIAARPDASLREIAGEVGISVSTARDVRERLRQNENPVPKQRRTPSGPVRTTARQVSHITPTPTLDNLKKDPSLRLTEIGRMVLRLLDLHSLGTAEWDRLIANIPMHSIAPVVASARRCAASWQYFADQLERRLRTG